MMLQERQYRLDVAAEATKEETEAEKQVQAREEPRRLLLHR